MVLKSLKKFIPVKLKAVPRVIYGILMDRKLGITAEGWYTLCEQEVKSMKYGDGNMYQPTSYGLLKLVAKNIHLEENDILYDLGSGKGRVCAFFGSKYKINKIIGIEYVETLAKQSIVNLANVKLLTQVDIVCSDASLADVSHGTVYFFYQPFGSNTLKKVLENIEISLKNVPRNITIVTINDSDKDIYMNFNFLNLEKSIKDRIFIYKNKLI